METTREVKPDPRYVEETSNYLNSIRKNQAALRHFFNIMPKGGDVHNHLTGSAYAETYFELAAKKGMYVNLETGRLYTQKPIEVETIRLSKDMDDLHNHRMALIDKWSIRNFQPYKYPLGPDEYFFGTFGLLAALTSDVNNLAHLMNELKVRAYKERVQYLEVMASSPSVGQYCLLSEDDYKKYDKDLKEYVKENNISELISTLQTILDKFSDEKNEEATKCVNDYLDSIYTLDELSRNGQFSDVLCRYQGYASRGGEPIKVFAQLYVVHKACIKDERKLLVGCNIVAAENGEKSMLYYRSHMEMFALLAEKFKSVPTSLHAGELTMGLVRPEHLKYHITQAVDIGKAHRIGHGVDTSFESWDVLLDGCSIDILGVMRDKAIPVEINLTSNEFILGVKDSAHPITFFHKNGIPIIISTDDPGILRTSLTEQFTLAVLRYGFSYEEIKQFVYNSIKYSFLPERKTSAEDYFDREDLIEKLDRDFVFFENRFHKSDFTPIDAECTGSNN